MYWQKITRSFSVFFTRLHSVHNVFFFLIHIYTYWGHFKIAQGLFNTNTSKLKELEIEPTTFLLVVIHSILEQETGA